MSNLAPLINGVGIPLAVSTIILLIGLRIRKQGAHAWLAAVAGSFGFAASGVALSGMPELPPINVINWMILLMPVIPAVILLINSVKSKFWAALSWVPVFAVTSWLIAQPMIEYHWESTGVAVWWIGSLAVIGAAFRWVLAMVEEKTENGYVMLFTLIGLLTLTSVLLLLSGSLLLAQYAGALAAATGPALLLIRFGGQERVLVYATGVVAFGVIGFLTLGHFFAELTLLNSGLVLLAGLIPVTIRMTRVNHQHVLHFASMAVPAMMAIIIAWRQSGY